MSETVNFLGDIAETRKSTRFSKREYFFELFEGRKNALVLPSKWQDPFENVILNAVVRTASGESGKFSFHEDIYGQCWTLHTASDAMWRIYSDKEGRGAHKNNGWQTN